MRHPSVLLAFALALGLTACGNDAAPTAGSGTAELVLTDDGAIDLARFEVDVAGLVFHKYAGASVSALPRGSRVDFAELEEVGELVGRVSLEAGRYRSVTMTLDFSNAEAFVVGGTTPAEIVDPSGQLITGTVSVEVAFPVGSRPEVVPNRNHVVQLDLDLSQAILVDVPANRVMFRPVIDVTFDPTDRKPVVTRGELASVDTGASTFVVRRVAPDGTPRADITVGSGATTVYQISGDLYVGAQGLQALASLPADSRVYVQGTLDPALPGIQAVAVESGAGVPGAGQDHVEGWIVGRSAGAGVDVELTVFGRSVEETAGTRRWFTTFTVQVAFSGTKVLQRGLQTPAGTDALQVGQRIWAFGTMSGTTLAAGPVENGIVRMLPTTVLGRAAGPASNGVLVLDVVRIDGVDIGRFDFSILGVPELDPTSMSLDVRNLDVASIGTDSKVAATGWMNAVGVMADQDFAPVRVVDRTSAGSLLVVTWPESATGPVLAIGTSDIGMDTTQASFARILDGFGGRDILPTPVPTVHARADGGAWFISQSGSLTLHRSFDAFTTDLSGRIAGGATVAAVAAIGADDPTTQVLTTSVATVDLR